MVAVYLGTEALNGLGSKEQLQLLDAVDSLRSQGISQHVSLPQIIVCGDQSSGKSSVLEAISGVSFPVKANTATRFPTELILRRTAYPSVRVSIAPHHTRSESEKKSLSGFHEELESFQDLPNLVENAKAAMGIMTLGKAFSKDILRIEISGPERPHLTIVDLPGLIHSENKHQSQADVQLITEIVKAYMDEPRSVILAVISANNDYPNQIVLSLARKADPKGLRTLGLITKPDALAAGSLSERKYLALARNNEVEFRHGWHVLKNRDTERDDWTLEQRDTEEEKFFTSSTWSNLSESQRGIKTLRERLSKLLLHQVATELPNLTQEISAKLEICQAELLKLGQPRVTAQEQRLYLVEVSVSLQTLLKAAVDGTYNDTFFGSADSSSDYKRRIRAVVQKHNTNFAANLRRKGHFYEVVSQQRRKKSEMTADGPREISRNTYLRQIVEMMERGRGRELPGMFNPLIVTELFQKQSKPWKSITDDHVMAVWKACRVFMKQLVVQVADKSTSDSILDKIVNQKLDKILAITSSKATHLLKQHLEGSPITYNHYFTETLQRTRTVRQKTIFADIIKTYIQDSAGHCIETDDQIRDVVDEMVDHTEPDMSLFAASEALDCSEAYYKVALKRFIDDVAVEVIETCLLKQLGEIFGPMTVASMSEGEISAIAGEREETRERRRRLQNNIQVLQIGVDTCKSFAGFRVGDIGEERHEDDLEGNVSDVGEKEDDLSSSDSEDDGCHEKEEDDQDE